MKLKNTACGILCLVLALGISPGYAQVSSYKDIINQYDPFLVTFNDMTIYTNDEDFREHVYALVISFIVGNEKVIKFIYKDDIMINSVKNYDDVYWAINCTVKKNNSVLFPAMFNISSASAITIKLEGYSNISSIDQISMNSLSSSFCYTSSRMFNSMELAYKFLSTSPDVNRPNYALLTTAEVLAQNIKTRAEIFYFGSPVEATYVIPQDPKKVIGTNILVQGKRAIELKTGTKVNDSWNITFTKFTDVSIVKNEPYYVKTKTVFNDLTNLTIISPDRREGYIAKADELLNDDLVIGLHQDAYINDQVVRQLTNLLSLIKAGVRVKADTLMTTNDFMLSPEREALSYFETNLKENDFNLDNQYVYDDYININRGILQKEIDLIKRYYQIK